MTIGLRIPFVGVDAVENADESIAALAQRPVEAEAARGRGDLCRVVRAHGDDDVGQPDAAEQRIAVAPLLEGARRGTAVSSANRGSCGPGSRACESSTSSAAASRGGRALRTCASR